MAVVDISNFIVNWTMEREYEATFWYDSFFTGSLWYAADNGLYMVHA